MLEKVVSYSNTKKPETQAARSCKQAFISGETKDINLGKL